MIGLGNKVELLLEVLEGKWRNPEDLEGLEKGQTPEIAAVICGDSRCQADDVWQQPRNYVFPLRTIGNQVLGTMGSSAYPTEHVKTVKVAADVGHLNCGAVTFASEMAAQLKPAVSGQAILEVVNKTLDYFHSTGATRRIFVTDPEEAIREELFPMAQFFANAKDFLRGDEKPYLVRHAIANVYLQTAALMRMRHVKEMVESDRLIVAGLLHDFVGRLGKKGSIYLVSYNGIVTGLETTPIAVSLSGRSSLVLPEQKVFMTR